MEKGKRLLEKNKYSHSGVWRQQQRKMGGDVNNVEQIIEILNMCGLQEIKFYTYFALKRTIRFHINDNKIPDEYREKIKIKEKVYRAHRLISI